MTPSDIQAQELTLDHQVAGFQDRRLARAKNPPRKYNIPALGVVCAIIGIALAFALIAIAPHVK